MVEDSADSKVKIKFAVDEDSKESESTKISFNLNPDDGEEKKIDSSADKKDD